jgi:mRNA interferase RelE/StbE
MSSGTSSWALRVKKPVRKNVERAPRPERERLVAALESMSRDPFAGDIQPLKGARDAFRRRVGDWRILFEVDRSERVVNVTEIVRRTSTTYRRR